MSEMVERVAKALAGPRSDQKVRWPSPNDKSRLWQSYVPQARDAIEAMREPASDQLEACGNHAVGRIIWRQMIDEALK